MHGLMTGGQHGNLFPWRGGSWTMQLTTCPQGKAQECTICPALDNWTKHCCWAVRKASKFCKTVHVIICNQAALRCYRSIMSRWECGCLPAGWGVQVDHGPSVQHVDPAAGVQCVHAGAVCAGAAIYAHRPERHALP